MSLEVVDAKLGAMRDDVSEIKRALTKMSEAITKLALIEQQQSQTSSSLERAFSVIGKVEARVAKLEQAQPNHARIADWVDRAVIALAGAALALMVKSAGVV